MPLPYLTNFFLIRLKSFKKMGLSRSKKIILLYQPDFWYTWWFNLDIKKSTNWVEKMGSQKYIRATINIVFLRLIKITDWQYLAKKKLCHL